MFWEKSSAETLKKEECRDDVDEAFSEGFVRGAVV